MEKRRTTAGGGSPARRESSTIVPVIAGPTASGKTALSIALAQRVDRVEIVSADSRQIYRGMDIGTAKPTVAERSGVAHHCIDIVDPDELFSAGRYGDIASQAIAEIIERGGRPIVVGGSGFYVKALFEGLGAPAIDPTLQATLSQRAEREGCLELYRELEQVDPQAAGAHSPNNCVKTIRALACYLQTGRRYSSFVESGRRDDIVPRYLAIAPPRAELYERINHRVLTMLDAGLLDEVRELLARGYTANDPGMKTVGYVEAIEHLSGRIDMPEMITAIQQATRRYAKRQMTWFRKVEDVRWLEQPDADDAIRYFFEQ